MERHGWLSRRPEAFRHEVLRRSRLRHFTPGDHLYRAGDPPLGMFGVIAGQLQIRFQPAESIGSIATIGQWVGDATAFMREPRWASMLAGSPLAVFHLAQADFDAMIGDAENCRHFAINTAESLAEAVTVVANLIQPDSEVRVAQRLLTLMGVHAGTRQASFDIAQADLATMCGLSRQTLNKVLTRLEARGILTRSYRRITIANQAALQELSLNDERIWR
jgi:CRP-like cAMP-binding protein